MVDLVACFFVEYSHHTGHSTGALGKAVLELCAKQQLRRPVRGPLTTSPHILQTKSTQSEFLLRRLHCSTSRHWRSSNLAGKGHGQTVVAFYRVALEQVTGIWHLPVRLQACSGPSIAEKGRT